MNLQGAISDLMKVSLAFYIGCFAVGRGDIPLKLVSQLRVTAVKGVGSTKDWGCPSISLNKRDCLTWTASDYR